MALDLSHRTHPPKHEPKQEPERDHPLPRVQPETVGIPSAAILAFVEAVDRKVGGLHSFMLLREGQVAAEGWWAPYAPALPHMLFSLSKSFTSTAVGLAVAERRLTVEDPVLSFFPDRAPAKPDKNLAAMQVRHLLTMSTGHDQDATGRTRGTAESDWVKAFLSLPVEHLPGSKFVYNSAATYMLSAILQKLTGETVLDYLRPRLFDPLGIRGATWESCPRGISVGGWGLSITTEDIARFGQLYLQRGRWEDRQLVPAEWVAAATARQVANGPSPNPDWEQGYGYQIWRCRHGAYRGDGAFGQFCVVMPQQEAVLAITSGVGNMQAVLAAVWEHLLPALDGEASTSIGRGAPRGRPSTGTSTDEQPEPLTAAEAQLQQKLSHLAVPLPEGGANSPTAGRISGRKWRFAANEEQIGSATLIFEGSRCRFTLRDARGEHPVECGHGEWVEGHSDLGDRGVNRVAAAGAWTAPDTYTLQLCFVETPFIVTFACRFEGDQITIDRKANVGFGPTERPVLVGRLAPDHER